MHILLQSVLLSLSFYFLPLSHFPIHLSTHVPSTTPSYLPLLFYFSPLTYHMYSTSLSHYSTSVHLQPHSIHLPSTFSHLLIVYSTSTFSHSTRSALSIATFVPTEVINRWSSIFSPTYGLETEQDELVSWCPLGKVS